MKPSETIVKFRIEKDMLLHKYRQGLELGLVRADFLTTSSIEVLQAFMLLLLCGISRDESIGKSYALLGAAIKIATAQGLHKEPTLFSSTPMEEITVELRRRLWHGICAFDVRTAGAKGQEPMIRIEDYTTRFPLNIDDDDLQEGVSSSTEPVDADRFTEMTLPLICLSGLHWEGKVFAKTYHWAQGVVSNPDKDVNNDPLSEILRFRGELRAMLEDMNDQHQRLYIRHCDPASPFQALALGLGHMLQYRMWLLFWYRIPRNYREATSLIEIRLMIFIQTVVVLESNTTFELHTDAERFEWSIGEHFTFHSIMHLISELSTPFFQSTDQTALRNRALAALQGMKPLKRDPDLRAWSYIRKVIAKLCAECACRSLDVDSGFSLTTSTASSEAFSSLGRDTVSSKDPSTAPPYLTPSSAMDSIAASPSKVGSNEYMEATARAGSAGSMDVPDFSYYSDIELDSLSYCFPDYAYDEEIGVANRPPAGVGGL
ncbi:hypothetical protein H2199_009298 [Coniosporium tulheliwenetii]|uniref:Uncharacterized protein n=1 Tax=Coniosporium tulheliwenetii TaxID=3383036 RepID=A0ACC2YEN6_9PEZI|nr:hypothetical protein H2199_009298 [Cladosporium sp. JES 115]